MLAEPSATRNEHTSHGSRSAANKTTTTAMAHRPAFLAAAVALAVAVAAAPSGKNALSFAEAFAIGPSAGQRPRTSRAGATGSGNSSLFAGRIPRVRRSPGVPMEVLRSNEKNGAVFGGGGDGAIDSRNNHEPSNSPFAIAGPLVSAFARTAAVAASAVAVALLVGTPAHADTRNPAGPEMHRQRLPPGGSSVVLSSSSSSSMATSGSSPYTGTPYTGDLVDPTRGEAVVELESGVTYRDLRMGTEGGPSVAEGDRVNIQWVLKRSNGYTIDASTNNDGVPFIFVVGGRTKQQHSHSQSQSQPQRAIAGLDEGIRGMAVGGIRRIVIPPSLAYVEGLDENSPGPVPVGFGPKQRIRRVMENRMDVPDESFLLDVKVTRIQ